MIVTFNYFFSITDSLPIICVNKCICYHAACECMSLLCGCGCECVGLLCGCGCEYVYKSKFLYLYVWCYF